MSQHVSWVSAKDTIVALASAPGPGAVSIIKISGPKSLDFAQKLCPINLSLMKANTFRYTKVFNLDKKLIDHALILKFTAPKSFTAEDVIEIQCHGGTYANQQILQACLEAGARMAEPGEFSFRAFRNQKIDLCQAESICNLISAKSEFAHESASDQLKGVLSETIKLLQENITTIVAILEAMIDYPEEGIHYPSTSEIQEKINNVLDEIQELLDSFLEGQRLSDAIKVGLIGSCNVGKSSLLNLVLMKERAIVTSEAGTTRDQIEEEIELKNRCFRFIDTAGLRQADNVVESIGITRSKEVLKKADLVLFVLDSNQTLTDDENAILSRLNKQNSLIVYNKCDLDQKQTPTSDFDYIHLSTKTKLGLNHLKTWLEEKSEPTQDALFITQKRHFLALEEAKKHLTLAKNNIASAPAEIAAIDLRQSLEALSQIIGNNVSEEILGSIFKNFCVGK